MGRRMDALMTIPTMDNHPFGEPECQILEHGGRSCKSLFKECQKNPGHHDFISVKEFSIQHLPKDLQWFETLETVKQWADRTVKMTAVSPYRPDCFPGTSIPHPYSHLKDQDVTVRCGTGFITGISKYEIKKCVCYKCKVSCKAKMEYKEISIKTAAHVVFDDYEARNTIIECFYDSEDREGVKFLYGISARGLTFQDTCTVVCTTHDAQLLSRLEKLMVSPQFNDFHIFGWGIIISHPHGCCKKITTGRYNFARRPASILEEKEFDFVDQPYPNQENCFLLDKPLQIRLPKSLNYVNFSCQCTELHEKSYFTLPKGTIMCLSQDSDWDFQVFQVHGMGGEWGALPHGIKFKVTSGTVTEFPSDAQFNAISFGTKGFIRLFYDISTCPGCSGAPVLSFDNDNHPELAYHHEQVVHSSAYKNGWNRSSYHFASFIGPLPRVPRMYMWLRMNVLRKKSLDNNGHRQRKRKLCRLKMQDRRNRARNANMDRSERIDLMFSYCALLVVFHIISFLWAHFFVLFQNYKCSIYFVCVFLIQLYFTIMILKESRRGLW